MFRAISGALSLALCIIVLKLFLPEVASGVIVLTVKVIAVLTSAVDQAAANFPN